MCMPGKCGRAPRGRPPRTPLPRNISPLARNRTRGRQHP
jgi:hypothetical protein